jgi:phosphatidylglycerol---prolipoprotein diacylglyceryl transferase
MSEALPRQWGIRPVLFSLGPIEVPSYSFFMALAVAVGALVYWREARHQRTVSENTFYILMAGLLGGALGAKLPILVLYWREIVIERGWSLLVSGRSIVGGLVGGTLSVLLLKRVMGINERKGNLFAPAIALGMVIGRVGCFLRGCCFGTATSLPWGTDFGDGVARHPTQLYEAVFMLGMFGVLTWMKRRSPRPGALFRLLMIVYFSFRFLSEFIRVEGDPFLGLTFFQWISLVVLAWYAKDWLRKQPAAAPERTVTKV